MLPVYDVTHARLVPDALAVAGRVLAAGDIPMESIQMKPRITVITLGVDDLERALRFYRDGLGLATQGIVGQQFAKAPLPFSSCRLA